MRDRRLPRRHPAERQVLISRRGLAFAAARLRSAPASPEQAAAQADSAGPDSTSVSARARPQPAFRFSQEAGHGLRALWEESVAAKQERVACLGASVRNDTVFVARILALVPDGADSMSISSDASIERCGPPEWAGTVHTHVAAYDNDLPSTIFSAQDRGVMRRWYQRWQADGVFCLVYSARDAHCEADGVVGGCGRGRRSGRRGRTVGRSTGGRYATVRRSEAQRSFGPTGRETGGEGPSASLSG